MENFNKKCECDSERKRDGGDYGDGAVNTEGAHRIH